MEFSMFMRIKQHVRTSPLLFISFLVLAVIVVLIVSQAPLPAQQSPEEPVLTVTILPNTPTSYEETTITIQVDNKVPLRGGPEIFDETRQIKKMIIWSHPVISWTSGSRTLPSFFGPKGADPLDEITIRVTIRDQEGREKTIRKTIQFES